MSQPSSCQRYEQQAVLASLCDKAKSSLYSLCKGCTEPGPVCRAHSFYCCESWSHLTRGLKPTSCEDYSLSCSVSPTPTVAADLFFLLCFRAITFYLKCKLSFEHEKKLNTPSVMIFSYSKFSPEAQPLNLVFIPFSIVSREKYLLYLHTVTHNAWQLES